MCSIVEFGLTIWLCVRLAQKGKNWLAGLIPIILIYAFAGGIGLLIGMIGGTITIWVVLLLLTIQIMGIAAMIIWHILL